ncbi:MAG: YhfL family protein [Candidatus Oceanisphaera merdipullorum]|nr:YhfL family protein [Candidatus Oceanisphaera merdipullorum]
MKNICKIAAIFSILAMTAGCSGTSYNKEKTCGTDYLLHPAISVPAMIGACDSYQAK